MNLSGKKGYSSLSLSSSGGSSKNQLNLGDASLEPLRVLGQGTFGRVFLAVCHKCRPAHEVCVKRIIVQNPKIEMSMILEEVYIISQLKHPNIVKFLTSFVHAGTVNIVMEYLPNGTVRDLLNRHHQHKHPMPKSHLLRYFLDILVGLEYLHIRKVIHRDLKPENLMLDWCHHIKICDFGISAIHTSTRQLLGSVGTPYYMAPEVMRGDKYDFKSDIWSFGCIVYEMCMGKNPFAQATTVEELRYFVRALTKHKMNCQMLAMAYGRVWALVCERMLVFEAQKRISLPELICIDPAITIPVYNKYFDYQY